MKNFALKHTASFLAFASCLYAYSQDVDPNTYYYDSVVTGNTLLDAESWKLSDGSAPAKDVSDITNIVFNKGPWANYYMMPTVNSITVNASGSTFNLNGGTWVASVEDTVLNFSDDTQKRGFEISQCGHNGGKNGFKVGGNLVFNSSKYMSIVMTNHSNYNIDTGATGNTGEYFFNVGGQLQFNHSSDEGFIRYIVSEPTGGALWPSGTGYTKFDPVVTGNIGGLSGTGVFSATKWLTTTLTINFVANSDGVFTGGEFTGAFTRFSLNNYSADSSEAWQREVYENSIGSTASAAFVMDSGDSSVKQTINLQSAKTFFGESTSETDIESFTVSVRSGYLEFNSELAIDQITLEGGDSFLKFVSAQRVGELALNGGHLVYGGKIAVGDFSIGGGEVDVVFSAEDLAAQQVTVIEFDRLLSDIDANLIFIATDENGNELGGEFSLIGELGGAGSLVYTVPEPAVAAVLLGGLGLGLAAFRRRR